MPRSLILTAGLLAASAASAQPPSPVPPSPTPAPPTLPDLVGPVFPGPGGMSGFPVVPPGVPSVAQPVEKSVEQMVLELEALTTQKAQIEKKAQDLRDAIRKKLDSLNERVNKLDGRHEKGARAGEPHRVGRIMLAGVAKKDEQKVTQMIGLQPGGVLRYPELDAARDRLEKAGFKGVEVVAAPMPLGSPFADILVRCEPYTDR